MAQDLKLQINEYGLFDIVSGEHDLETVNGLETTIAVLLFTDARADSSEMADPSNRRGWVGNILRDRDLGGKLWLSAQLKNTQNMRNKLAIWARESLTPLIDSNLATNIQVEAIESSRGVRLDINIQTREGDIQKFEYWINTDLGNLVDVG